MPVLASKYLRGTCGHLLLNVAAVLDGNVVEVTPCARLLEVEPLRCQDGPKVSLGRGRRLPVVRDFRQLQIAAMQLDNRIGRSGFSQRAEIAGVGRCGSSRRLSSSECQSSDGRAVRSWKTYSGMSISSAS